MNRKVDEINLVALAGLLHDIGKFYQRTGASVDAQNLYQYCKRGKVGNLTHQHAVYTALAIETLSKDGNFLHGLNTSQEPFGGDDSFINMASRHHRPETFLQWCVAIGDRVSSGFERMEFEDGYNLKEESPNYLSSRLISPFEELEKNESTEENSFEYRFLLTELNTKEQCVVERKNITKELAQKEYQDLWNGFLEASKTKEKKRVDILVDDVDSLLHSFTSLMPSATAFGVMPNVPLYDHSKLTAAFAVALYNHHKDSSDKDIYKKEEWEKDKFLLIQGDFFGIQKFIFSGSAENSKSVAKSLRGRSAFVSIVCELAALKIIEKLNLSSVNIISVVAGKFMILSHNTKEAQEALQEVQNELNGWFLEHFYGEFGIGISSVSASCNDFNRLTKDEDGKETEKNIKKLLEKARKSLELKKSNKFGNSSFGVFEWYLKKFDSNSQVCKMCDKRVQEVEDGEEKLCKVCYTFKELGKKLANSKNDKIYIYRDDKLSQKRISIFGYEIDYEYKNEKEIVRRWDISLPDENGKIFNGTAKRSFRAYIPLDNAKENAITFEDIAEKSKGISALITLKADIDNLGALFAEKLHFKKGKKEEYASFAKVNFTSRLINQFFTSNLAYLLKHDERFKNKIYTVYAGGDDLFLIGSWDAMSDFVLVLKEKFDEYFLTQKSKMSFSAGCVITKSNTPVNYMANSAEKALEEAKRDDKNGLTIFKNTIKLPKYKELLGFYSYLKNNAKEGELSSGYIYSLSTFAEMAQKAEKDVYATRWNSQFRYMSTRNLKKESQNMAIQIGEQIKEHKKALQIGVFRYLYEQRSGE